MPVYLITLHAFRSWSEDNPKGYVQRGQPGIQPPNTALARHRARHAKGDPVRFAQKQQRCALDSAVEVCSRLGLRLHAASTTPTHLHLLVSWRDERPARPISTRFKRIIGMKLSEAHGTVGNRWFSRGCNETEVVDRDHFDHLITSYLPKHVHEGGIFERFDARRVGDVGTALTCGALECRE